MLVGAATDKENGMKNKYIYVSSTRNCYFHFKKINQSACNWDVFVRKENYIRKIEGFAISSI